MKSPWWMRVIGAIIALSLLAIIVALIFSKKVRAFFKSIFSGLSSASAAASSVGDAVGSISDIITWTNPATWVKELMKSDGGKGAAESAAVQKMIHDLAKAPAAKVVPVARGPIPLPPGNPAPMFLAYSPSRMYVAVGDGLEITIYWLPASLRPITELFGAPTLRWDNAGGNKTWSAGGDWDGLALKDVAGYRRTAPGYRIWQLTRALVYPNQILPAGFAAARVRVGQNLTLLSSAPRPIGTFAFDPAREAEREDRPMAPAGLGGDFSFSTWVAWWAVWQELPDDNASLYKVLNLLLAGISSTGFDYATVKWADSDAWQGGRKNDYYLSLP